MPSQRQPSANRPNNWEDGVLTFGRLDILVNNAAIAIGKPPRTTCAKAGESNSGRWENYTHPLPKKERLVPKDFLRRIGSATLPWAVTDPADLRDLSLLVATDLVEAILPTDSETLDLPGVVLRITPSGRAELR
ncbi:hypothetical protein [Variovorax boronicumulans]